MHNILKYSHILKHNSLPYSSTILINDDKYSSQDRGPRIK
jgi:hypothetical protein